MPARTAAGELGSGHSSAAGRLNFDELENSVHCLKAQTVRRQVIRDARPPDNDSFAVNLEERPGPRLVSTDLPFQLGRGFGWIEQSVSMPVKVSGVIIYNFVAQ